MKKLYRKGDACSYFPSNNMDLNQSVKPGGLSI